MAWSFGINDLEKGLLSELNETKNQSYFRNKSDF